MADKTRDALRRAVGKLRADLEQVERLIGDLDDDTPRNRADMLDMAEAAAAAGVAVATWKTYVSIGRAPVADAHVSGRPLWKPETVQAWAEGRNRA